MCGIAVIFDPAIPHVFAFENRGSFDHPLAQEVSMMTACLKHRGPDASGVWTSGPVALGHTHLSILDLSPAAFQPMNLKGRYWITYNGEVYNFVELRNELRGDYVFQTGTDTEVILAAYDRWGSNCVEHFNGMFAFVIWDDKEKQAFGARDRLGVKPLYYARCPSTDKLALASEIKALRALKWCNGPPNRQRLYDFFLDRVIDHTDETMFSGIYQIRPGHRFTWLANRGLEINAYWRYRPTADRLPNIKSVYDTVRALFMDSVRIRLRSDVPVGCLLSGGIDSSSVFSAACVHEKELGRPIYSVSTRVVPRTDENALIDRLIAGREARHFEDTPSSQALATDLRDLVYVQDEPFADGSMLAHFRLMRLARDHGIRVLLSGQGGDEFWDGYYGSIWNGLATLVCRGHIAQAMRLGNAFAERYAFHRSRIIFETIGHCVSSSVTDRIREGTFRRVAPWIAPGYFEGCSRARQGEMAWVYRERYARYLYNLATAWTLPGFLHFEDRNSMRFGVEVRLPFLDWRLVEYAGSLDPRVKMWHGETKHVIREALRDITPDPILDRHHKQPFPVPIEEWLREPGILEEELIEVGRYTEFAGPLGVETMVRRYRNRDPKITPASLWRMLSAVLWYERFFRS